LEFDNVGQMTAASGRHRAIFAMLTKPSRRSLGPSGDYPFCILDVWRGRRPLPRS